MPERVYPGDLVTISADDPDCRLHAPSEVTVDDSGDQNRYFFKQSDIIRLRNVLNACQHTSSGTTYLVVCSSTSRALLMHPDATLWVIETKFINETLNKKAFDA